MNKYKVATDFSGDGFIPIVKSVVTAIPPFFSISLFLFWIFGTASSYFVILKTTGKKRFLHTFTAMSFVSFIASLILVALNESSFTYLSGYWVGFYIVMTIVAYILLDNYK